jgi:hypothetical protein
MPMTTSDADGALHGSGTGGFRDVCTIEVRASGFATRSFPVRNVCTNRDKWFGCLAVRIDAQLTPAPMAAMPRATAGDRR